MDLKDIDSVARNEKKEENETCEVCGESASFGVNDFIRYKEGDSALMQFAKDGSTHFFCAKHNRESRTRDL